MNSFVSILFTATGEISPAKAATQPDFFVDLNLDQLIETITQDFQEYDLLSFYQIPLEDTDAILFRQEVMRDFDDLALLRAIRSFSVRLREMREHIKRSRKAYYKYVVQRSLLTAAEIYCGAIRQLASEISICTLLSRGFIMFRDYLESYISSSPFLTFEEDVSHLRSSLSQIRYCLLLKGDRVTVRNPEDERDYSVSVEETFQKFWRTPSQTFWVNLQKLDNDNHIQAQILDGVAKLHPDIFGSLDIFCVRHAGFLDRTIVRFDREIQFYVAYINYIERLRAAGLNFCLPQFSRNSKEIEGFDTFDIVLAGKLIHENIPVVCNDFHLSGCERIFVVSGPNHGGKTTFARMFGQMHYLAKLGLPVPGRHARLFLFDHLFTHFECAETITNLRGKLQDDLVRIHDILEEATPNSLVIMNEIFSSTTLKDALFLGRKVLAHLSAHDLLGVCVTFLDELASFNDKTVSVVSMIDSNDPTTRTFKLERRPADGIAYALAIAEKHGVTYERLKERIPA